MKRNLLLIFLLICSGAHAQKFNSKYLLQDFYNVTKSERGYTLRYDSIYPDEKQRQAIRHTLVRQLQAALNHLDDKALKLDAFYDAIWGKGFTQTLREEIVELKKSMADSTYRSKRASFKYVPHPDDINSALKKPLASVERDATQPGEMQFNLVVADAYKRWLVDYYNTSYKTDGVSELEMDMAYIEKWRQLEKHYQKAKAYAGELKELYGKVMDCSDKANVMALKVDTIMQFEAKLPKAAELEIHRFLQKTVFYQKWLWYSNGKLSMNPLMVTQPWRVYPAGEPNSLIPPADVELFKSMDVDTALKRFSITRRIVNKVPLPLSEDDNTRWNFYHYDAGYKYVTGRKQNKAALTDKEKVAFLIHNLPKDVSVSVAKTDEALKDMSAAAAELDNALSIFSGVITDVGGEADAVSVLTGLLNFNRLNALVSNAVISVPPDNIANLKDISFSLPLTSSSSDSTYVQQFFEEHEDAAFVMVNKFKVILVKNQDIDKKGIIRALTSDFGDEGCKGRCSILPDHVLDSFIVRDNCFALDYKDNKIKNSAKKLQDRFECFLKALQECSEKIEALSKRLNKKLEDYQPYLLITNRSLPPAGITVETDKNELYRTAVIYPEIPEAPKTGVYTMTATKKTGDGETSTVVAKQKIRFASLHYIDVSAGIAFTTSAYTIGKKNDNNLPERVPGEQFKVIAGLHIYPCGIFKIDNSFPGEWKRRSSIFLGISIPKALDNYYLGYSYDWVPGIKTIAGLHFFQETRFKVLNNQVTEQASGLALAGPFISVNIQPATFIKALGLF